MTKCDVLGIGVTVADYDECVGEVIRAAQQQRPLAVTALAVHGLVSACLDKVQAFRLKCFGIVAPDGQPVRWALSLLHRVQLPDRVYGPTLMLRTCEAAAAAGIPIYLYGSTEAVLTRLADALKRQYPNLLIAGREPSKFRRTTAEERSAIVTRIIDSGARIVFAGLGCPRQEVFAFEYHNLLSLPILAVGAAFDYNSGSLREPCRWIQDAGLQWLFRLLQEPRRLWRRYVLYNSLFIFLLVLQALQLWKPDPEGLVAPSADELYG